MTLTKRNMAMAATGLIGTAALTAWFSQVPKDSVTASILLVALGGLAALVNVFPVSLIRPELLSAQEQRVLGVVAVTLAGMATALAAAHPAIYWLRVVCGAINASVAALGTVLPLNGLPSPFSRPQLPPPPGVSAPTSDLLIQPGPSIRTSQAGRIDGQVLLWLGIAALAAVGLLFAASGCAPGTDGARQGIANAESLVAGAYPLVSTAAHADLASQRANITDDGTKLHQHEAFFTKALGQLDADKSTLAAAKATCDAIDAGQKGDVNAVMSKVAGIVADIQAVIASMKGVL